MRALLLPLLLWSSTVNAVPCSFGDEGAPAATLNSDRFAMIYRFEPEAPVVGVTFKVRGRVCPSERGVFTGVVTVDADMPQHGHGMNYRPRVRLESATGEFIAEGFVLHMPGLWRFRFKLVDGTSRETLYFEHLAK